MNFCTINNLVEIENSQLRSLSNLKKTHIPDRKCHDFCGFRCPEGICQEIFQVRDPRCV